MAKTELAKAYVQIMPSADGIKGKLTSLLGGEASGAGKIAGLGFVGKLKGIIAAAGIGKLVKESLLAGADLQQSLGGVDTIYADAADSVKKFANEAAAAGISANDYAEQAVSFGASLKQAFGGDMTKAADAANTAIMDMADNAAKMGTDVESIQNAYQGFAKQNYTMLDNLKLGYGGTKTEMQRLLEDANKLNAEQGKITNYSIDNLGDVYEAIHVVQEDLGLTGVAADEAATTFSGSLGAMKAAAENLLANLSLGEDIGPSLEALAESVWNFGVNNLLPMVWNIVKGIATYLYDNRYTFIDSGINALESFLQGIVDNFPQIIETAKGAVSVFLELVTQWLPTVLRKGREFLDNLILGILESIPGLITSAVDSVASFLGSIDEQLPDLLAKGGEMLGEIIRGIFEKIPEIGESALEIAGTLKDKLAEYDWLTIGKDIVNAIIEGIKSMGGAIFEAITEGAGGVFNWVKDKFKNAANEAYGESAGAQATKASSQSNNTASKSTSSSSNGFTQNVNIYSPKALSASEVARQTRNANQQTILAMRGVR